MKWMKGLTIVFGALFLGHLLENFLPFLMPGTIYSMFIVFLLLTTKAIQPEDLEKVSEPLLDHLSLFFIPPAVGIIEIFPLIQDDIIVLLGIMLASTLITLVVTGVVVEKVMKSES